MGAGELPPQARARTVATGRARAELYARSLGLQVVWLVSVAESGGEVVRLHSRPRR